MLRGLFLALLVEIGRSYGLLGTELSLTVCTARALPIVLSVQTKKPLILCMSWSKPTLTLANTAHLQCELCFQRQEIGSGWQVIIPAACSRVEELSKAGFRNRTTHHCHSFSPKHPTFKQPLTPHKRKKRQRTFSPQNFQY